MRTPEDANKLSLDRYDIIRAQQKDAQPGSHLLLPINESPVLPPQRAASEPAAAQPLGGAAKAP